jgi:uncharacterized membrane protein YkvA (DUF1232 family)
MLMLKRILPIVATLLYVVSPIDAVPDFLPGIGWVDDLLAIGFLLWYLSRQTPGRSPWDQFRERMSGARRPPGDGPRPEDLTADFSRMDPYALLEVAPGASPEELKSAYRRAVARYHPDKVAHLGREFQELAHRKLLAIQQAYEALAGPRR